MSERKEPGWFDWRVTWSAVIAAAVAAGSTAYAVNSNYYGIVQDIDRLKNKEMVQDDRALRLERAVELKADKIDVKEALANIASDVKDTRKDIRELLMARQSREALNRWGK